MTLLAIAMALLASTAEAGPQRLIASSAREGVDGMAALQDVLVLRQGSTLHGLDPYSLQQLWIYRETGLIAGPIRIGDRLFAIRQQVWDSDSGQTTHHHILEIAPASGLLRGRHEAPSATVRLLSSCGRAVFLLDESIFTVSGEEPVSRVSLAKHLKLDLARAFVPERVRLAGNHLLTWMPELRIAISFDLERNDLAWRRGFPEKIVDFGGCGSVQVATTAEGTLLGLEARTGKTIWQSRLPQEPQTTLLLQLRQPLTLSPGTVPAWLDPKDGTLRTLEEAADDPRIVLEDRHGRALMSVGNRLTVHGPASGNQEWAYDAREPVRLLSAAEGYVALVTGSGRLDVLGQSRPVTSEETRPDAGAIRLSVDPEDAFVWLDGSYLGPGGRSIENLSPGPHRLRLFHPDRRKVDVDVVVAAGQTTTLTFTLERSNEGAVRIDSTPTGAIVFIDGELRDKTPFVSYDYAAGRILQVTLSRTGYRNVRQNLPVTEDGAVLSANLKLAPPLGSAFGLLGGIGTGPIRGWREADILEGRVQGNPYRPADGDTYLKGVFSLEHGWRRLRLFGRFGSGTQEEMSLEVEGGLWVAVDRGPRFELGVSYLALEPAHPSSSPPRQGVGWGSTADFSAPLERWDHPIPRVFVDNEGPGYLLARCRLRPRAGLFLELGAGRQMEKARLRGTALVEDAEGHLVRDPARSYDFTARNDGIVDARLQIALGTFRIWRLAPSTAVDIHYQHRWADFGPARESTGELTVGLGILYFNHRPGATP